MGNKKKAVFITFEGAEGCGKSTHARLLCAFLRRVGFKVLALREPGSTRLGEALRTLLLHKDYEIPAEAELFLYEAARSQLIHEKILPNMYAYDCIICDRFQDATFVYQAYAGGVDRRFVDKVGGYVVRHAAPEATIIFDVPVAVSMRRIVKPDRIPLFGKEIPKEGVSRRFNTAYRARAA